MQTQLTLGSEGHEKAEENQGSKVSSQITSVFTLFPTEVPENRREMSSQHNHSLKEEWEWNHKCISPIIWFQASFWLTFIILKSWDSFHQIWIFIPIPTSHSHWSRVWFTRNGRLGVIRLTPQGLSRFSVLHLNWNKSIMWKMLPLTCILCLQWKGTHTINRWSLFNLIKADFNQT